MSGYRCVRHASARCACKVQTGVSCRPHCDGPLRIPGRNEGFVARIRSQQVQVHQVPGGFVANAGRFGEGEFRASCKRSRVSPVLGTSVEMLAAFDCRQYAIMKIRKELEMQESAGQRSKAQGNCGMIVYIAPAMTAINQ